MKIIIENADGTETERVMSRAEVLEYHAAMLNHSQSMADMLESIKSEIPTFQDYTEATEKDNWEEVERKRDEGLTSEINTSSTMVSLADTIEGCINVLKRHPEGFKGDGPRKENGTLRGKLVPFDDEENEEAEKWLADLKAGKLSRVTW
jgi:hypothetical protein